MQKIFKSIVELDLETPELILPAQRDENLHFSTHVVYLLSLWE